jgi:hypothetical protein
MTMDSDNTPWWLERLNRRKANLRLAKIGTVGSLIAVAGLKFTCEDNDDDVEVKHDSLDLQKSQGWDVGSNTKPLSFSNQSAVDSLESMDWTTYLDPRFMLSAYEPKQEALRPYMVSTLVQALNQPTLRTKFMPINSPAMRTAYARGLGMREIIKGNPLFNKTLLMVDTPGPESIAFAAALADLIDPIITFDNWPHPLGVVPSQNLLSAMLFYAKEVFQKSQLRSFEATPMIILDRNRLSPYTDEDDQFDNRYVAKIPAAENLTKLGIVNALYIVSDEDKAKHEADDLNEDFVAYKERTIKVSVLPQSHFVADPQSLSIDSLRNRTTNPPAQSHHVYYYGGRPWGNRWFYSNYPGYGMMDGPFTVREQSPFRRPFYEPIQRNTLFSRSFAQGTGISKAKPENFGRATTRVSRSTGTFTGVRSGRSGSYGRSRSFFSS